MDLRSSPGCGVRQGCELPSHGFRKSNSTFSFFIFNIIFIFMFSRARSGFGHITIILGLQLQN